MKVVILFFTLFCFSNTLFAQKFQKDEKVDVYSLDAKLYRATIVDIDRDKYKIHFDGYHSFYDVWMTVEQLQKVPHTGSQIEIYGVDGKWYKASILDVSGNQYKVHYEGYDASNDRWITREQFRTINAPYINTSNSSEIKPAVDQSIAALYAVGSKVEISWGGSWYKGSVLEVKGDQYKINYNGYGDSWNEWVRKDRLRAAGSNSGASTNINNSVAKKEEAVVKQSYSGTTGKLYLRTFGRVIGSRYSLDINWIFLGADGTIVYDPKNGVDPINYKSEEQNNGSNIGKYQVVGKKMIITWRNGKKAEWSLESKGGDFSTINGGIVSRQDRLPANYRISGQYAASAVMPNVASVRTFVFSKDGTFTHNSLGTVTTPDVTGQKEWNQKGIYTITGNTLTLNFADGTIKKAVVCIWDMGDGTNSLVINGSYFPQEK